MTARISLIPRRTRGHRPRLQCISNDRPRFVKTATAKGEDDMNLLQVLNEIHRALGELRHEIGKIQGELVEIRRLSYRVSMLEQCQSWLKGGWAMLAAACGYLFHGMYAR